MLEKFVNDQVTSMLTEIAWYKATDSYDECQYAAAIDSLTEFAMYGLAADLGKNVYDILADIGVNLHEVCNRSLHVRFNELLRVQQVRAAELDARLAKMRKENTDVK